MFLFVKKWRRPSSKVILVKPVQEPVQICVAPRAISSDILVQSWNFRTSHSLLCNWCFSVSVLLTGWLGIYWAALGTTREHPAAAFHCENEKEKNFIEKKIKLPFSEKDPILNGKVVNVSISVLNLLGLFQAVFALGSGLKVSWEAFWPPLYLINAIYAFKHRILIFHYGKT